LDKGLIFGIYEEHSKLNTKTPINKWANGLNSSQK
jgi:hypothetical protein